MDRTACAQVSHDHAEPQAGTAATALGWVVVEHDGPWTPRAPDVPELGAAHAHLDAHPDVRLQLSRPVRLAHDPDALARRHLPGHRAPRTVLLGHASPDPAARWLRRLEVPDDAALLGLDPAWCAAPTPPALGEPVEGDVWLVCAHARRDACCAQWGRPVALALALAGHAVWETTHTGGHRFAGTTIVLPTGLSLGRLDRTTAVAAAEAHAAGRVDPTQLRGRCALPRAAQAAEVALRQRLGVEGVDDVVVRSTVAVGGHLVVELEAAGTRWRAEVLDEPTGTPRPISDDAEPTDPGVRRVTALARA